jgi:hypothetical protein
MIPDKESISVEFKSDRDRLADKELLASVVPPGFDPIQQEQMLLGFLDKNGLIACSGAADLCRISPFQATRLLAKLVDAGLSVKVRPKGPIMCCQKIFNQLTLLSRFISRPKQGPQKQLSFQIKFLASVHKIRARS